MHHFSSFFKTVKWQFNTYPYWKQGNNYNLITYFAKVQLKTLFSISGSCWYIFSPSFLFKNVVSERFGYVFEPHQSSENTTFLKLKKKVI